MDTLTLFPSAKCFDLEDLVELEEDNARKLYYIEQLNATKEAIIDGKMGYREAKVRLNVIKESYRMNCK